MAKARAVPIVAALIVLGAPPAMAWTPDFDAAFDPFPHRGPRPVVASMAVALPVARPPASESPAQSAGGRSGSAPTRLSNYCSRPGKSSLSWIRVSGRRYYCPG